VEPARDGFGLADARRLPRENDKRGLKSVFRVLAMTEDALAQPQHHGAMALQQTAERLLVARRDIVIQELAVRRRRQRPHQARQGWLQEAGVVLHASPSTLIVQPRG